MSTDTIYENGTYLENNPTWHEQDSLWKANQIVALLEKNNISPLRVCEAGCGAGEILNCLANHYNRDVSFSGYEISPQAFEICKKKERSNLVYLLEDLLLEKTLKFDVAMAIDVFEHVEDYLGFLRKFRQKARYKVFHIPLDLSVLSVFRSSPLLRSRYRVGHIHYFIKETALATLRDTGYTVIDYHYTKGSLELNNRGWKSDLMKIPRRLLYSINQDVAVRVLGGFSLMVLAS